MPSQEPTTEVVEVFDSKAAFAAFIKKAAEFGFTNEIDDESGQPEYYLFCLSKYETQRIIVPVDYQLSSGPYWNVIIDRLSHWPYQQEDKRDCSRTVFYRASLNVTDLDFFEKLIVNIFPKSESTTPY